ncbi:MAG TPA: ATP-binding protein [Solirubrobacteraceae bacterium]|nr:ATP-binding protein [Solirubrobacteraceae bacterium]
MSGEVRLQVELPRARVAPGDARRVLRNLCANHVEADLLVDAELLVSELVTNAIRHGEGDITLCARVDDDRLVVEVIDQGSGFEYELRRQDFEHVGGWGLDIVDDLSSRWGVHEGTTHVWFELERPGPRLGEPAD